MDTRAKIVPFETLRTALSSAFPSRDREGAVLPPSGYVELGLIPNGNWIVVPGLFDPMTADQASRLRRYSETKQNLAAVVLDRPGTLLDASSRSLLVAALRCVTAVAVATPEQFRNATFHCEMVPYNEAEDRQLSEEFIDFVARREMQPS